MADKPIKTKEERVKAEERRLKRIYKGIESKKMQVVQGLIQRAAHLRITLDDFAEELDRNGYTEMFQQGREQTPYERKRPVADLYNTMNTSYQKAIKQLTDLLPKEEETRTAARKTNDDGFEDFITDRLD